MRPTIFTLLLVLITSFIVAPANATAKNDAAKAWELMESEDTEQVFWHLIEMFRKGGADIPDDGPWKLTLDVQEHLEIINQYNNGRVSIRISRLMKPDEATGYWENWSKVLAAGNFDHKRFFHNDRERHLLANFNVLVLASHEIGHYLDFRYKMSDRSFGGFGILQDNDPLNCTEAYADRFATGMIRSLSADERFKALVPRYLDLIKEFNDSIPEQNRYYFNSPDLAGPRCGEIDLMENGLEQDGRTVNANFFRQYTSAYFNRHQAFLSDKEHGDLKAVIERDLVKPFFARSDLTENRSLVRTTKVVPGGLGVDFKIFLGGRDLRDHIKYLTLDEDETVTKPVEKVVIDDVLFNEKGELRKIRITWETPKPQGELHALVFKESNFTVALSDEKDAVLGEFRTDVPKGLRKNYNFSDAVLLTDNELVLVMTPFDVEENFDHVLVLHATRKKGKWATRSLRFTIPGLTDADEVGAGWFATPKGDLYLARNRPNANADSRKITTYLIDRKRFSAKLIRSDFDVLAPSNSSTNSMKKGLWRKYLWQESVFGNDDGKLFVTGYESNLAVAQLGNALDSSIFEITNKARLFLGIFKGIRDGDGPIEAKISTPFSPRFIKNDRFVFVDLYEGKTFIREVILR